MVSSTKMRPAAMQFSPLLKKTDPIAILTARSRSKSPKMISGLLPPSSREAFFKFDVAQDFMIVLPTGVEPVKPSFRTRGWSVGKIENIYQFNFELYKLKFSLGHQIHPQTVHPFPIFKILVQNVKISNFT